MDYSYWHKQQNDSPLFPDIEWNKPEQRNQAGKLGIIGGTKLGFAGVAESYSAALNAGTGYVRVLLPDSLKKTVPVTMTDVVFGASTSIGSLSKEALSDMCALGEWANGILLTGDAGRNSETAVAYEEFISRYEKPLVITRDAIDLLKHNPELLANRAHTILVLSFAQLQKLFQALYYPKMLVFSMHLMHLVETLHKFTITYPITIATLHRDTLIVASDGEVTTTQWENPMAIWRGITAARAASYLLWTPAQPLQAITASLMDNANK